MPRSSQALLVVAACAVLQLVAAPASARVIPSTSTDIKQKPVIPRQHGKPPTVLVRQDIITGTGRAARKRDRLAVKYVLRLWTGRLVDEDWDRSPFRFSIGSGEVIKGFDQGLRGIRPGGRRQLTIPPGLAYGRTGQGLIPPNATLIFIIDAVSVKRP